MSKRLVRRIQRDERGSLIVAMTVVLVITTLSMAVFSRTVATLTNVRLNQDSSAAKAQADAGLSDALFRIDQYGTGDITNFCVGNNAKCTVTNIPAAPDVSYSAVVQDNNTYQVTSEGVVNNRTHAIQATVQRQPTYPFAIFGNGDVTFEGNGSGTIQATNPDGSPDSALQADVGSNGTVTCNSGGSEGNQQISYQDSWKGCPSQVSGVGTYDPLPPVTASNCPSPNNNDPPVPCVPASGVETTCPATFTGTISGVYYCTSSVAFSGTVTVSGAFAVYVIPRRATRRTSTCRAGALSSTRAAIRLTSACTWPGRARCSSATAPTCPASPA